MKQLAKKNEQDIFQKIAGHEQVVFCNDPITGLQAIIAIHDTTLGPGLGGTRMYPYENVDDALEDALRLSEGMTYKCAAADIDFGGAKAVIIGDPDKDKTPAMFRKFAQYVDSLNGRFYTGTDMGTTMDDFVQALKETNFINGIPEAYGGSGDSSIPTSQGVVYAIQATNKHVFGDDSLGGKTYAIQGLGKVGYKVAEHLLQAGADLFVTDIHEHVLESIQDKAKELGGSVTVVGSDEIYSVDADVFVPCAMGAVLNDETIPQLTVKAVVGSANNQLKAKTHAQVLADKGILYAPDYIVNAGGLIQVADELYEPNKERVLLKTKAIYDSLLEIYEQAKLADITTEEAANRKCQQTIDEQRNRNNFFARDRRPKWNIRG
ncbi:Leu/Phe/Val dehydrogenase [Virgibacillus alimentarius]|uniref:Phenylalanine dehydrogenase n=1 Tax=Virgibacillus alimentarius TaxID=698769 RepID=A0ABS4SC63_9BACI|nr:MULTISPECIES: amino acid dehydrogenase [Virgibacillus]MBP2259103.1 phenylalanine dehydrogenase [Virgibacillus alimentarius]HLR69260.1 amino acid dehydrogenase [Virgibacillus sp.]